MAGGRFDEYHTPVWADRDKIRELYKFARRHGYTIDHEIPARGKYVCGLHVHENLRCMRLKPNIQKSNHWPVAGELFDAAYEFIQLPLFGDF